MNPTANDTVNLISFDGSDAGGRHSNEPVVFPESRHRFVQSGTTTDSEHFKNMLVTVFDRVNSAMLLMNKLSHWWTPRTLLRLQRRADRLLQFTSICLPLNHVLLHINHNLQIETVHRVV